MIDAVLDTNILASGFAGLDRPTSTVGNVVRLWLRGRYGLLTSDYILEEFERALAAPYFVRVMSPERRSLALDTLRKRARMVAIAPPFARMAAHPHDDPILATGLIGGADFLVTGDKELLRLGDQEGMLIVPPRTFLQSLGRDADR